MRATKRLRRLFDERGIKYRLDHYYDDTIVTWRGIAGMEFRASDAFDAYRSEGVLYVNNAHLTPEQAIAATVGETCSNNGFIEDGGWYFDCSKCGCEFDYADFACEFAEGHALGSPHYCPNCGARVVDE